VPLPFLHKFMASIRRSKFELQPLREAMHLWPLSLVGAEGAQMLAFEVMGVGEAAPRKPGIFVYARRRGGVWQALYIGESANLSARLAFNEIAADALLSGATDIHILRTGIGAKERRDLADRLIATNRPPLNEEERTKLEGIAVPKAAGAKSKSRAA
jgi:hypothetical protein